MLRFIGLNGLAFVSLVRGRARFQGEDLALIIQEFGPRALPIVTLISFLVGLILAFVGAVQLRQFGAQISVADLVGIAMATEMGAMMTAIIMAGRTGAAFAAQLGNMRVNEEIDALITMVIGADRKDLRDDRFAVSDPAGEPGYAALVAAMSRALGALSREIAGALRAL